MLAGNQPLTRSLRDSEEARCVAHSLLGTGLGAASRSSTSGRPAPSPNVSSEVSRERERAPWRGSGRQTRSVDPRLNRTTRPNSEFAHPIRVPCPKLISRLWSGRLACDISEADTPLLNFHLHLILQIQHRDRLAFSSQSSPALVPAK